MRYLRRGGRSERRRLRELLMKASQIIAGEVYVGRTEWRYVLNIFDRYVEFQRNRINDRDAPDSAMTLKAFARWAKRQL